MLILAAIIPVRRVSVLPLVLVAMICYSLLPATSRGEDKPHGPSFLFSTHWSAAAYSEKAAGSVCWIDGADGSLRLEVLRNDQAPAESGPDLAPLMERRGYGWTLVLGPDQQGTLNGWGTEWRQVPVGLAQLVRLVTASLHSFPERPPRFPFATQVDIRRRDAGIPRPRVLASAGVDFEQAATWRYQLAPLSLETAQQPAGQSFRRKMIARGRGTGGIGEILNLQWARSADTAGHELSLRSSRRPGILHLAPVGQLAVTTVEPEVFLPLWPLSQFFTTR